MPVMTSEEYHRLEYMEYVRAEDSVKIEAFMMVGSKFL